MSPPADAGKAYPHCGVPQMSGQWLTFTYDRTITVLEVLAKRKRRLGFDEAPPKPLMYGPIIQPAELGRT